MKKFGIRFTDIDKIKTQSIKLDPGTAEKLGFNKNAKSPTDYIKKYLNDTQIFDNVQNQFNSYVEKTLPDNVKQNCKWCLGEKTDESNKKCTMYYREAEVNFYFASYEFVRIVENNKHLIKGNALLKSLTIKFFECFAFNDGRVWFDLEKMTMHCLKAGFMTLSQLFSQNSNLQNLSIISAAIQNIDDEQLDVVMFKKEPPIYLEPEKTFFENKQRHYEREHFIEKENKLLQQSKEEKSDEGSNKIENPYPEIFPDAFSFQLFNRLYENYKDSNNPLADFSFIYRKMYSLNYILEYQKPEMFKSWLSKEPFGIILDSKFKTLDRCRTDAKADNFSIIIELVRKEYNNVP